MNLTMNSTVTGWTRNLDSLILHSIMEGLRSLWYESFVSNTVQNPGPTSYVHHLLQDAGIVIIEIDWSHFPLYFKENALADIFGTNAIEMMPPPKVSIRSIPKLSVPQFIRPEDEDQYFYRTLQMTETGLFVVCDPVHLLPEESTPKGDFHYSYIRTGKELMKNPVV